MSKILPIIVSVLIILAIGCNAKKVSTMDNEMTNKESKMVEDGYKMGTIQLSDEESSCPVTIKLADPNYSYLLDPINIDDEFKKNGLEVWLKFNPLRMQNRCENAHPVELSEIKKN